MTSDETRVHSAMIADLLNPEGLHQMGDIFLKLFIRKLEELFKLELNLDYGDAKLFVRNILVSKLKIRKGKI